MTNDNQLNKSEKRISVDARLHTLANSALTQVKKNQTGYIKVSANFKQNC